MAGSFLYLKKRIPFLLSKFTTKPESTIQTFGLNLLLFTIIIPASKLRRNLSKSADR
jgi:hypothetical protein